MTDDLDKLIIDYINSCFFNTKDATIEVVRDNGTYPYRYIRKNITQKDIKDIRASYDYTTSNIICIFNLQNDNYQYRCSISIINVMIFLYHRIQKLSIDTYYKAER